MHRKDVDQQAETDAEGTIGVRISSLTVSEARVHGRVSVSVVGRVRWRVIHLATHDTDCAIRQAQAVEHFRGMEGDGR